MSYYGNFAAFYDAFTDDVDRASMAAFIAEKLKQNGISGGILLDAGCGTGGLSVLCAQMGFDVIGTDISPEMLQKARERAQQAGVQLLLLNQPLEELDLYGTVRAAICTLDTVNHLTGEQSLRQAFARIGLFLEPGGVFLFDCNTYYKHSQVLGDNAYIYDLGDTYCGWQNTFYPEDNTTDVDLTFFDRRGGSFARYDESFTQYYFTPQQLESALAAAGMRVLQVCGGYRDQPLQKDSQRAVYIASKER